MVNGIFDNIGTVQDGLTTIAQPLSVTDAPDAKPLRVQQGAIRFDSVRFDYGGGRQVINDLHLDIKPGEKIGLIGPSGAGKSTLVNLLLRLYDLNGGRITIDGQDIASVTQTSLRAQIGMITQTPRCCTVRFAIICCMAVPTPAKRSCGPRFVARAPKNLFRCCPIIRGAAGWTRTSASAA